jgi:hypothetical protein
VVGTAFAVPVVASFDMSSLTVSSADALAPNQVDYVSPAIVSAGSDTFAAGHPGVFTVQTTGTPPPSVSESGALPPAVDFTDNGDGTATVTGTPPLGSEGAYPLSIAAANGHPPDAGQGFTLIVSAAPAITGAVSAQVHVGRHGAVTVTASGYPTPALGASGTPPTGVTFTDNGNGTASLAGTPDPDAAGFYPLTLTAVNAIAEATRSFDLSVTASPAITSPADATLTARRSGRVAIVATGFPLPAISASGALPAGVAFTDHGDGTATLSGAAGATGSYPIVVTAANGIAPVATQQLTLSVSELSTPVVTITRPSQGASYDYGQRVLADYRAGDPSGISSLVGTIADGARLDTVKLGRHTFSVRATAGNGASATASVAYTVLAPGNEFTVSHLGAGADGTIALRVTVPGPGTIEVMVTAWDDSLAVDALALDARALEPAPKRFAFARLRVRTRTKAKRTVPLLVEPNRRGRRLVASHRYRVTLRLWVAFTPVGGRTRTEGLYGLHLAGSERR